ncbi:hypothetical protein F4818DRAFT_413619 [Hypoxylon cercidicola]|nr:hypothetical protein F4818DRAFT_413619 [Hypoxylon cercidicola]
MLMRQTVGVTAAVSIPAILLAWNVNNIPRWLRPRTKEGLIRGPTPTDTKSDVSMQQSARIFGQNLRRRWRKREENTVPQHEGP